MRPAPLFLVLALLAGCGSPTAVGAPFELDAPFWLEPGQFAAARDGSLVLRVRRVLGDSRCPPTAVCVWQGEVQLEVEASGGAADVVQLDTLHSVLEPRAMVVAPAGRVVHLDRVEGGTEGPWSERRYRARFVVSALAQPAGVRD